MPKGKFYKTNLKKDYQRKGLKNPFFRSRKKSWRWPAKLRFWILTFSILALAWFFWFSPVFLIKDFRVEGLNRIPADGPRAAAWQATGGRRYLLFSQRNIFMLDSRALAKSINQSYNFFTLEIQKSWLKRQVTLKIKERDYAFIWQEGESYYFSDQAGNIIRDETVSPDRLSSWPIIENRSGRSLIQGNQISLDPSYLPFTLALAEEIKKYPDFKIKKYFIDNEMNTVKLSLEGPEIYFSTREGGADQLAKLKAVKDEMIKDNFKKLKYLDLRYKDKVYYQ